MSAPIEMAKRTNRQTSRRRKPVQLHLDNVRWGGHRPGAGRKKQPGSGVAHRPRAALSRHHPVHVTIRVVDGMPRLRSKRAYRAIAAAMTAGRDRFGFRLIHHSVQANHIHLIVEAKDRVALARGMKGLQVRMARRLNALAGRRGRAFADRYHCRHLRTPAEVRGALRYVLNNWRHHGRHASRYPRDAVDMFSSAASFDGWRETPDRWAPQWVAAAQMSGARSWLLTTGWRRRGLLQTDEAPG